MMLILNVLTAVSIFVINAGMLFILVGKDRHMHSELYTTFMDGELIMEMENSPLCGPLKLNRMIAEGGRFGLNLQENLSVVLMAGMYIVMTRLIEYFITTKLRENAHMEPITIFTT
uniref:Uncharacterized protein n=1 Tax=Trieres chinensis TaxID=1514140 RepID=A0A7S1ZN02_TRICV|mmetsp:Transcript_28855/g.59076  ORF Transcript_28855/g.59076 Transcript_28855/m.59076 type:complete len:116 (+) Transcript_28855:161-508(+)